VTHYPATLEQRSGATPAGDGPGGRAIAAFVTCGAPGRVGADPEGGCAVVLERTDGSQVMIPAPIGDTPVSLSPDGGWVVYLTRDATVVRNLLTGAVHRTTPYLQPITWSANNRWLLAGISRGYGGDFVVLDTTTGAQTAHQHPSPSPGASAAPAAPAPAGPYYPCAVTDAGDVVRYPRPDMPDANGAFVMDIVDSPTARVRRSITARLDSSAGHVTPLWQEPSLLTLNGQAYLLSALNGAIALLPVPLSGGRAQVARPVIVTGPGPHPAVGTGLDGPPSWSAVAALPHQGLVYRVPGTDGDDVIAVDPATGSAHLLMHVREGWAMALAALP
jgi:hypothetical protein